MKSLKILFVIISIGLCAISCNKDEEKPINVEVVGTIQQQGITTYQYGTHVITGYALRSSNIDLDNYIGQTVTVIGHLVEGYPIEGGPDYIEVEEIE